MRVKTACRVAAVFSVGLAGVSGVCNGQEWDYSYAPGLGNGWPCHSSMLFAPIKWEYELGVQAFKDHVSDNGGPGGHATCGQRYTRGVWLVETAPPNPDPTECTVLSFYDLIMHHAQEIGVLFIPTHGSPNGFVVESYVMDSGGVGEMHRNERFDELKTKYGFTEEHIYKTSTARAWCIGVYARFIRDFGRFSKALVYIACCYGIHLTDDFVQAGLPDHPEFRARVAIGPVDS